MIFRYFVSCVCVCVFLFWFFLKFSSSYLFLIGLLSLSVLFPLVCFFFFFSAIPFPFDRLRKLYDYYLNAYLTNSNEMYQNETQIKRHSARDRKNEPAQIRWDTLNRWINEFIANHNKIFLLAIGYIVDSAGIHTEIRENIFFHSITTLLLFFLLLMLSLMSPLSLIRLSSHHSI